MYILCSGGDLIHKLIVKKPWGKFEQFTSNEKSTVKLLTINPNQELSLQYHKHRAEFWKVISGIGFFVIGNKKIKCKKGDIIHIPRKTRHKIIAKDLSLLILEISFGKFDENDIIRIQDKYNRI